MITITLTMIHTHTIDTPRGNNIGYNIINYLRKNNLYGNVTILTIDTTRNIRTRTSTTVFKYNTNQ